MNIRLLSLMTALLFPLMVAGLGGCGGGGGGGGASAQSPATPPPPPPPPPPPSPAQSVERAISPASADGTLTAFLSAHFVATPNPQGPAENRLFVMLPGTGAEPRFYREVARTGAAEGYHAIGLTYPNGTSVFDLCAGDADPDCAGRVRREVVTGEDSSPLVSIAPRDSIAGRLTSLLTYLHTTYPSEGWGQYVIAGAPDWSRISIAGHSQGAGHAAYLGKLQFLKRIVMFSGPSDVGLTVTTPAMWLSQPSVTPVERYYGFTHTADDLVPLALVENNWRLLGLDAFGAPVSVDAGQPPFQWSRQLTTSAPPNPNPIGPTPSPTHASPVVDAYTPIDTLGRPVYRAVWVYSAFP